MAAVTTGTPIANRHVAGNMVFRFFVVSGVTGSTLNTNMVNIVWVDPQKFTQAGTVSLITGITVAGGVLTFTSSAPMVTEVIEVISLAG